MCAIFQQSLNTLCILQQKIALSFDLDEVDEEEEEEDNSEDSKQDSSNEVTSVKRSHGRSAHQMKLHLLNDLLTHDVTNTLTCSIVRAR